MKSDNTLVEHPEKMKSEEGLPEACLPAEITTN